jgi:hypothetical protein
MKTVLWKSYDTIIAVECLDFLFCVNGWSSSTTERHINHICHADCRVPYATLQEAIRLILTDGETPKTLNAKQRTSLAGKLQKLLDKGVTDKAAKKADKAVTVAIKREYKRRNTERCPVPFEERSEQHANPFSVQ